jgi:hypothetical protein
MSNAIHKDLLGKVVLVSPKCLRAEVKDRRFLCEAGFGCHPNTMGRQIYGKWVSDGEEDSILGMFVESIVEQK